MDPEILFCVLGILAVFATVAVIAYVILHHLLKSENIQRELERQAQAAAEDPYDQPYDTRQLQATVVDQSCTVKLVGTKTPKATKVFTVLFRTSEGELLSLQVPEEMYDGIEKEQTGLLTLVDGRLYSFEPQ